MSAYNRFADIYDSLITEDVDYSVWQTFIMKKCDEYNIQRRDYLDLGCGTGNLSLEICKYFTRCWCVDLSEDMLLIAEKKFRDRKIKARFIRQNMTELNLNSKFDLITSALDCVNYLCSEGELNKLFGRIYEHLSDGGIFIFDINSEYKLRNILGENIFTYNSDDVVYIWENSILNDITEMELTFFVKNRDLYERFDEIHRERIYTDIEIRESLRKNGLQVVDILDNYKEAIPDMKSERITYIISKVKMKEEC